MNYDFAGFVCDQTAIRGCASCNLCRRRPGASCFSSWSLAVSDTSVIELNCLGSRELPGNWAPSFRASWGERDSSWGHLYFNSLVCRNCSWPSYSDFMDEVKLWLAGLIASFYRQALNFYNLSGLLHFNRIASIRVGDFWYQSNIFNLFLVVYSDQLKIAAIDYTSRAWECRIPALCGYWVFYFCLFYALYFTLSCFASMTFRLSLDSMVMRSHWHLPIRAAIEVQWTWLSSWNMGRCAFLEISKVPLTFVPFCLMSEKCSVPWFSTAVKYLQVWPADV